ncbi:RagB/SusD family nutrient uptake outer membrane protein [Tamlana agarivorans]|uniref:RagB/SusD family nutrient uptake outer membrane protein n=1 Tax=Pseudotamlana agarivorans TaxID=481183 RepID=A0ACC5U9C8_9FLAO|nr:RagB/SusD family nutrient uptake outer membrane protein [Tamlana agarivorans]MBU2950937.1 RagB/SusD family nutrient uptake outer membrane protein [Tamlana agarivorans]
MNIKFKIGVLAIIGMMSSCEDYLVEEPPIFISASNYWQTEGDARTAVDGAYEQLHSQHNRWWACVDAYTDDQVNRSDDDFGSHTVSSTTDMWERFDIYRDWWRGIGRANNVIENVPSIDMDNDEKNAILGEARALRALYYFHLVKNWGDQPLMDSAVKVEADFKKQRVDTDIIYDDIIIPDLKFAEEFCKDQLHDGHITKWSAKIILADVYLTRAGWRMTSKGDKVQGDPVNWELAKEKAKDIIDNSPHALNTVGKVDGKIVTPAYGMSWDLDNPFTPESMLEISYYPVLGLGNWMSRESNPHAFGVGYWGGANDTPLISEGITQTVRQMDFPGNPPGVGRYIPTPDFYDAFEPGDERRDYSILTRFDTNDGGTYLCQPTFRKYIDISYYVGEEGTSFQYTNSNIILYRYADALLIYAEAQNEADGSPNGDAYNAINEIRNRAGLANLTPGLAQSDFRDAVLQERRVELNAEFKRKSDLRRTNRLASATANINLDWSPAQGAAGDYRRVGALYYANRYPYPDHEWIWPIPESEMQLNSENNWYQNAGYK